MNKKATIHNNFFYLMMTFSNRIPSSNVLLQFTSWMSKNFFYTTCTLLYCSSTLHMQFLTILISIFSRLLLPKKYGVIILIFGNALIVYIRVRLTFIALFCVIIAVWFYIGWCLQMFRTQSSIFSIKLHYWKEVQG